MQMWVWTYLEMYSYFLVGCNILIVFYINFLLWITIQIGNRDKQPIMIIVMIFFYKLIKDNFASCNIQTN